MHKASFFEALGHSEAHWRRLGEDLRRIVTIGDAERSRHNEYGLRTGDLGAVVEAYEPDGLEVEFVSASGRTAALVTLSEDDVRSVGDHDLIA